MRLQHHIYHSLVAGLSLMSVATLAAQDDLSSRDLEFFEKRIRPVLIKECYDCHQATSDDIGGGLVLDSRDGLLQGGDSGPALVAGKPSRSLILKAMSHRDEDLQMPPDRKLGDDVLQDFQRWIENGAIDPRQGEVVAATEEIDIEKGRQFWSFQPIESPQIPVVQTKGWSEQPIDRFVMQGLEAHELKPVDDASGTQMIRRLYFDLVGLPPSPKDVVKFLPAYREAPEKAIRDTVDRLLESPQFGERWGRHWLDVARFAESSGGSSNQLYPHAWRYRDYVIDALNADKPYDEFVREQIAGDLIQAVDDDDRTENLIATGFLAIGAKSHNERNRRQFRADLIDEQIDATFQAFQGLTVACARCHDHKFDPIPQEDYYAVAGIFLSTDTHYGTIRVVQSNHPSELIELPSISQSDSSEPLTRLRRRTLERQIEELQERRAELGRDANAGQRILVTTRLAQLENQLASYDESGQPIAFAMGVEDARFTFDSPLLVRGEIDQPGNRIPRGVPQVLTIEQPRLPRRGSGRLEMADWLASESNPLTARVMANRIWKHLIGKGLVPTVDNFGQSGMRPSHPELLDYLATSFIENDWSIKSLIREIATSRTYRLSSQFVATNDETDPENTWIWRMPNRRLEAEALRDSMLLLAGELEMRPRSGSDVSRAGEGSVNLLLRGSPPEIGSHRAVYAPIIRDQLPEVLTIFDFPDPSLISGERATTTIPAQSLFMMNNPFVIQQADRLASRLLDLPGTDAERIKHAYLLCFSRPPSSRELDKARRFVSSFTRTGSKRSAWGAFGQALFTSAEFAHR